MALTERRAGFLVGALVVCVIVVLLGLRVPTALGFLWRYSRIDKGMSFEEVDLLLSPYERKDFYNTLIGLGEPPEGGIWFCHLGGTSDFNRIEVKFDDDGVLSKDIYWDP